MGFLEADTSSQVMGPWSVGTEQFLEALKQLVAFDAMALGVIEPDRPQPDAFLATAGTDGRALSNWCEQLAGKDPLLSEARKSGSASGRTANGEPGPPLPADQYATVHLLCVSRAGERAWYLALGRSAEPFTDAEQRAVELALRMLQAEFDFVTEPGLGRLLLGKGNRLIHADPRSEGRFLDRAEMLDQLASELEPVVRQRWPSLKPGQDHDLALELGGRPRWVRVRPLLAARTMPRKLWYVELRPLGDDDIPVIGKLEDDRVAQALGYLSDNYDQAPPLAEVADVVQTSPFHFHRLFVRHAGISPKHYLLRMQLMIAKWMLRHTRTPIGEVATATGFASHGHFTATFHRFVGMSPSAYRER